MDTREQAYKDYKKGMKYKEIAEKYGVSVNTVKSWAARYWNKEKDRGKVATRTKKVATKEEESCNQKRGEHLKKIRMP